MNELEEIRIEAFESCRMYNEQTKLFYGKQIYRKGFFLG